MPSAESLEAAFQAPAGLEQLLADAVTSGEVVLDMSIAQARDLLIGVIHGLTAHHLANEPELPVGSGRFGSQVPAAVALFRAKWDPQVAAGSFNTGVPEGKGKRSTAGQEKRNRRNKC